MFLDSAYLAKFYLNEPDSPKVRHLIQNADSRIVSSEWSILEVTCAFHRHLREGQLSAEQHNELLQAFHKHTDDEIWTLVPINRRIVRRSSDLLKTLPAGIYLRAGDAIQLFSVQEAGESEVWSNDRHLLAAAPHFGITGRRVSD